MIKMWNQKFRYNGCKIECPLCGGNENDHENMKELMESHRMRDRLKDIYFDSIPEYSDISRKLVQEMKLDRG